jgi:glycosyltransferase involved in cell wall biosynthesis
MSRPLRAGVKPLVDAMDCAKRILIDARCLHTGIGTYLMGVLSGVPAHKNGWSVDALARPGDVARVQAYCDRVHPLDVPMYSLAEQFAVRRAGRGYDLLHVPHYNAPVTYRGPMLVSILDLVHIMDPTFRRMPQSWLYARPMLHTVARRAQHIVTLSEFSKQQIVERLGVPPEKVTVIYCGVAPQFRPTPREEARAAATRALGTADTYVLYVGNLKPHKNVAALLRAYALLHAARAIAHRLVLVGDDARWRGRLQALAAPLGINEQVTFVPQVAEAALPAVYAAAEALVLPSHLEGFGLPVIEAMACGTPVVCARAASLPEVAGDAAEMFDPTQPEDLAAALCRVLDSPERAGELRRRGWQQAAKFAWVDCARRHFAVYGTLLAA